VAIDDPTKGTGLPTAVDPGLPPSVRLLAEGKLDHPECAVWDADDGCLIAGGEDGQLYRVGLDGTTVDLIAHRRGAFLCGLALDAAGAVYACDIVSGHVLRFSRTGDSAAYGDRIGTPNYPAFAPDGTLYVTESGTHNGVNGRIRWIAPGGEATFSVPLSRPLAFANGLVYRDGTLYVVESDASRVVRVPAAGGTPETIVELPGTVPDGIAFDSCGALWITCYQPNRIYRLTSDGELSVAADDPGGWLLPMPTNVCFAGEELETVVAACLGGWFVTAFDAPCAGVSPTRPEVPDGVPAP
jgi:gluconolactonase